jgi:hypothetical protein
MQVKDMQPENAEPEVVPLKKTIGVFKIIKQVLFTTLVAGCAHGGSKVQTVLVRPPANDLKEVKLLAPVDLKLKAKVGRTEIVDYYHRMISQSFEDGRVRSQKEESVEFATKAETLSTETDGRFVQVLSIPHKDGAVDLHAFALPDIGENLEIEADAKGHILRAAGYPRNSMFYVPPISLPAGPVVVGDTWAFQANWIGLEDGVPFKLDMVSILRGFWSCGVDTCAEIEISGAVGIEALKSQLIDFKSTWRGKIYFAIDSGTVVWSRTDSEELFATENVYRKVNSCLEGALGEPPEIRLPGIAKPSCESLKTDI